MVTFRWIVTLTPLQSGRSRLVRSASRSLLGSIPGPQVAPQNYGGLTIALDGAGDGHKITLG